MLVSTEKSMTQKHLMVSRMPSGKRSQKDSKEDNSKNTKKKHLFG